MEFNTAPYYDDYDENKKFYRILFNPVGGRAVQARELTTNHSIKTDRKTWTPYLQRRLHGYSWTGFN